MLTASQIDKIPNDFLDLWEVFQQETLNDIARRVGNVNYASASWQVQRLIQSGLVYEETIERLAIITGQSEKVLRDTFEKAGVTALRFDDAIYKEAGLTPPPLSASPSVIEAITAGYIKTNGILTNLTRTTANASQRLFIEAADIAYLHVSTGTLGYDQAIRRAIDKVGKSGLSVTYPSGHVDKLDVAMRRAVLTGVNQTVGVMQNARADQVGSDLVEVSAHIGARPEHAEWQGKIYSRTGTKYPDFVESTGYGTMLGLSGVNCRHSWFPFFAGISDKVYKQAELNDIANKSVTYNGQEMTIYEASQEQRRIERKIREWKRRMEAQRADGFDGAQEYAKVREWQARARDLIRQTGLPRQYIREKV
ncbi:MAG: hypothetical protein HOG15_03695 [Anaerolineae bacterium]|jgi:hypothetical protein|nr:hypothetical protein [Anaerolineae bacterium]MBT6322550.1 hypothetical protein [Anaerolineae bacterium]